jgi:surfactin synthase thioesterase subunit
MTPLADRLWIPRPGRAATRRVYCFHHAGGTSWTFAPLALALPPTVELAAIELPGRGVRQHEAFSTTVDEVMADLEAAWATWTADGRPFGFFGHSMGALLAHEFACRLATQGRPGPDLLVVSSVLPPHRFVERKRRLSALRGRAAILAEAQRLNGTPAELLQMPDMLETVLTLLEADIRLCTSYEASAPRPLPCPLVAIGGDADPDIAVADLDGWAGYTQGGFSSKVFRGDHFHTRRHWPEIAQLVAAPPAPEAPLAASSPRAGRGPRP